MAEKDTKSNIDNAVEWLANENSKLTMDVQRLKNDVAYWKDKENDTRQTIAKIIENPKRPHVFFDLSVERLLNDLGRKNVQLKDIANTNAVELMQDNEKLKKENEILKEKIQAINPKGDLYEVQTKLFMKIEENKNLLQYLNLQTRTMEYIENCFKSLEREFLQVFKECYKKYGPSFLKRNIEEDEILKQMEQLSLTRQLKSQIKETCALNAKIDSLQKENKNLKDFLDSVLNNGKEVKTCHQQQKYVQQRDIDMYPYQDREYTKPNQNQHLVLARDCQSSSTSSTSRKPSEQVALFSSKVCPKCKRSFPEDLFTSHQC